MSSDNKNQQSAAEKKSASAAEKAAKAAEAIAEKASNADKKAEAERGAKINTICIRDCLHKGIRYSRDRPGPVFYGEISSPHFRKA